MSVITWDRTALTWTDGFASTDLDSLANGGQKTSTLATAAHPIDNTITTPATMIAFEATLASAAFGVNAQLIVVCLPKNSDGSYPDGTDGTTVASHYPWLNYPHAVIGIRNATAAQQHRSPFITIPPEDFKLAVINRTGVVLASSGNMIAYALLSGAVV